MHESHRVHLTKEKKRKLLNGHSIQLKHEELDGDHCIVLDKKQSTKLRKAKRTGAGMRIQFHNDHLMHDNVMHGEGFRELLSKAKQHLYNAGMHVHNHLQQSGVYDQVKGAVKRVAKYKANSILREAKFVAHDMVNSNADSLHPSIKKVAHKVINDQLHHAQYAVNDHIDGYGIKDTNRKFINTMKTVGNAIQGAARSKVGKQILKGVAKVAVPAILSGVQAETGVPVGAFAPAISGAVNQGIDGLGIGGKRKRMPVARVYRAGALYPSGGY